MTQSECGTLPDILLSRGSEMPGRTAFVADEEELTFGELADRAVARAGSLQALGVKPRDRVAVIMPTGLPFVEVFWGLQLLGACPCVLNPSVAGDSLARRIALVRPRLVITEELAAEMRPSPPPPPAQIDPDDLAFLQLTSGTSGEPRAAMILHRNLLSYLRTSRTNLEWLGSSDVFVCWVPPWHDLGLVRFIIGAVWLGIECHIVPPSVRTIPLWLRTVSEVAGTYTAAPDFAIRLAARMVEPTSVTLTSLRMLKSGGEPVRWSTIAAFEQRFELPGVVLPGYGLGEATLGLCEHIPGDEVPVDEHGTVSCGPPDEAIELRAGSALDAPEEILVRGERVFAGYLDAAEETAGTLRDGWLHTGDSGYLDAEGRLFVLGRREGMIKRAGAVVSPRELEEPAQQVEGVKIAAASSVSDAGIGELIVVAVETDLPEDRHEDIIAGVMGRVTKGAGFAPGRIVVLPRRTIPRTENGKIRHARLRELLEQTAPSPIAG
ncbi:MAG TPA: AMP-binding protein [Solirubrobacteraceae bacterium]